MAWGGLVGPTAFLGAWVVGGATRAGYGPVSQAISQLAAVGAPDRYLMTAGFVIFGLGAAGYSLALRAAVPGPAWLAALATGLATLGVAAVPLGRSSAADVAHGGLAGAGYLALVALPLLAGRAFDARGARTLAALSNLAALVSAVALALSVWGPATGLFQRIGLTTGHAWMAASAVALVVGRLPGAGERRRPTPVRTSST